MQDSKSEYKLLAAILDNPDLINKCRVEYFTENRREVFKAMQKMYSDKGYVTPEGLENLVRGTLPSEIFAPVTTIIDPVLDTLKRLHKKRVYHKLGEQILLAAQEYDPDPVSIEMALEEAHAIADFDSAMFNAGYKVLAEIEQKRNGTYRYVKTGLPFLDAMMGGEWPRKAISAVIADPGGAKTALVCNSQLNMARLEEPVASLFISMEMSKESLHRRWAANILEIDTMDIKRGEISSEDQERIAEVINYINTLPIYVIDEPKLTFSQIAQQIRYHVKKFDVKVVFIDYLQIIQLITNDKNKELGDIGKMAKELAKSLDIHICFISQKTPGKDGVWQIRDSGDFPAALDVLFNLESELQTDTRQITVEFRKNREGPLGSNSVIFDGRYQKFSIA